MINVDLTGMESRIAILVGTERQLQSILQHRANRPGVNPDAEWTNHVEGAGGELAFAKAVGWYWAATIGAAHGDPDVRHVHVRRRREHHWDLLIRRHDPWPGIYALVTGCLPHYRVHGWINWPADKPRGRETRYKRERDPAWGTAPGALRDLTELPHALDP